MSLDRDFDESCAWLDATLTPIPMNLDALESYLCGDGPDPYPHETPADASWLIALDRMNGCDPVWPGMVRA